MNLKDAMRKAVEKASDLKHEFLPETIMGPQLNISANSGVFAFVGYEAVKIEKNADNWEIRGLLLRRSRGTACLINSAHEPILNVPSKEAANKWLDEHKMTKEAAANIFKDSYKEDIKSVYPALNI